MPSNPTITIRGLDDVNKTLKKMTKPAAVRLIRKAFRRALVPVRNLTKQLAPKDTGDLAGAVKILAGRTDRGLVRQRIVIARRAASSGRSVFHGSLQELGWMQGSRKLGDKRKHIEGKHFMKKAYEQLGDSAADHAEKYLWDGIENFLKPI